MTGGLGKSVPGYHPRKRGVEQHLHAPAASRAAEVSTSRPENLAPAARKTASAVRRSIRNSSTNSSRDTPSASQSKSCCTGSRLSRKHGAPLMRPGSTHTASSRVIMSFIGLEPCSVEDTTISFPSTSTTTWQRCAGAAPSEAPSTFGRAHPPRCPRCRRISRPDPRGDGRTTSG